MVSVGVYTVWLGEQLLYVGYSGRNLRPHEIKSAKKAKGLMTRIKSHRSGLRASDPFCIYVCDRFVVPKLDSEAIESLANGGQLLDGLTRRFVRQELSYRFITTDGSENQNTNLSEVPSSVIVTKPSLNSKSGLPNRESADRNSFKS